MPRQQIPLAKKQRNAVARPHRVKALIKLYFHKSISKGPEPAMEPSIGLMVPLDCPAERLPAKVRRVVVEKVLADEAVRQAIESRKVKLSLATSLQIPSLPLSTLPLDGKPRLGQLGDIFENPAEKKKYFELDAHIQLGLRPVKAHQPPELAESVASPSTLNCFRLANMPVSDGASPASDQRNGGRHDAPAYCQPLLVWFDDELKTVKFTKIHAYEMEDFCIGDINENEKWNQQKYTSNAFYVGLFNFCQREGWGIKKFKERLSRHVDEDWGNLRTGMPILPTYCFTKFDPAEQGLGLSTFPKQGIDVAVRCVNQYEANGKLKNLSFRRDIRLVIKQKHTMDDIFEVLDDEINAQETEDGVRINSAKLFEREHRQKWEWQLWVMPQTGERKLYRFSEGSISQFLSEANEIRPRDKKVYMEAHVMPNV